MKNVHGNNEVKKLVIELSPRAAFQLTFWPSLAVVLVAVIAKVVT